MPRREHIGFQLVLPILGSQLHPVYKEGVPGAPYLNLSQSSLEISADHLDHPRQPILDPRDHPLPQHLKLISGSALHEIIQTTHLWKAISRQPRSDDDVLGQALSPAQFRRVYNERLNDLIEFAPTTSPAKIKRMRDFLNGEQLILPWQAHTPDAEMAIYKIIARKVIDYMQARPPFTDTPGIPSLIDELEYDLPFPDPEVIVEAWNYTQQTKSLSERAKLICNYHDSVSYIPTSVGRGFSGTEVRYSFIDHDLKILWSGRLDGIWFKKKPNSQGVVNIVDFKLGSPHFPNSGFRKEALRLSLFMTAQAALRLKFPDDLEATGKTIQLNYADDVIDKTRRVTISYLGFAEDPPTALDFTKYFGRDWNNLRGIVEAREGFVKLVKKIHEQVERLQPILG